MRYLLSVAAALAVLGCASSDRYGRMYAGCPRPGCEVATFCWSRPVDVLAIDGDSNQPRIALGQPASSDASATQQLDVLPGPHTFSLIYYESRGLAEYQSVVPQTVEVNVHPGCEYIFTAERDTESVWRAMVSEWTPGYNVTLERLGLPADRLGVDVYVVVPREALLGSATYAPGVRRSHFDSRVFSGLQRVLPLVFERVTAVSAMPASMPAADRPVVILKPRFRKASYLRDFWSRPLGARVEFTVEISEARNRGPDVAVVRRGVGEVSQDDREIPPKGDILFRRAMQGAMDEVIADIVRSAYRFAVDLPGHRS